MPTEYRISLYEHTLSLADIEAVTGVAKKNSSNWITRGNYTPYAKSFTGGKRKRLLCPIDAMNIAGIGELIQQTQMPISHAAQITRLIEMRVNEIWEKMKGTDISNDHRDPQYAILRFEDDRLLVGHHKQSELHTVVWEQTLILLPLDRIIYKTFDALFDLREAEVKRFESSSLKTRKLRFGELTLEKDEIVHRIDSELREYTDDEEDRLQVIIAEIERLRKSITDENK